MSHLDNIIENVRLNGSHTEVAISLLNGYFRGDDGQEKLYAWAKSANLQVIFNQTKSTYLFIPANQK